MKYITTSAVILLAVTAISFGIAEHAHQKYLAYLQADYDNY